MTQKFTITGMTCASCSARVEKAVKPIASDININLLSGTMRATYTCDTNDIIDAVKQAGYDCEIFKLKQQDNSKELKEMQKRMIWSFVFLIPLMYLSMAHMLPYSLPTFLDSHYVNAALQFILTVPILILNKKFFTSGFKALFKLSPNMDSLVAIGAGASMIYSIVAIFIYESHELYFESAAMIIALITLGKYLETRSKGKTKDAVNKLMNLAPENGILLKNGKEIEVLAEEIQTGDKVVIKPGMRIPVDGVILEGNGDIDQSAMTGESIPVSLSKGDKVVSGTINKNGNFIYEATGVGAETTLARIIELVEEASSTKAPAQRLADKISSVFVPSVIIIAIVTFAAWLLLGQSFEFAFSTAVAVLVISCPCALGLATPVAIMVATGKGAENGILFKNAASLENLGKVNTFIFDKTGTITNGTPTVTDITDESFLDMAYTIENISEHPLSKAICKYCKEKGANLLTLESGEYIIGKGIVAQIDGNEYKAGNEAHTGYSDNIFSFDGKTPILFTKNGEYIGTIAVADTIKPDAAIAIKRLSGDTIMITGDNEITAYAITQQVGIKNFIANAMPQDKEEKIANLIEQGKIVAMVGDGINDAPALTRADVGIAIGAGSDIAIESADIVLTSDKLSDVAKAVKLSKKTLKNIRQNLFWAFFYNCLGIPLAAGLFYTLLGWTLNPMIAAACMSLSSISVVLNALRLKRFKGEPFNESEN